MPAKNQDLHGSVPESSAVALLLIDVINDLEFEGAEELVKESVPMAHRVDHLRRRAKAAGIPVIYVNDNFGRWQSDFNRVLEHCLQDGVAGEELARILRPEDDDYFVLKPKHSAFYATTLDTLLAYLGAKTLIMTGIAGNICILFSANDAYMRDFNIVVPADCVISNTEEENRNALEQMKKVLKADITLSPQLDLEAIKNAVAGPCSPEPAGMTSERERSSHAER
ncbi:MAG: Isochorismatase [Acidobacteria bacterium]|nr:Isochorismatase [Acidobacteriota bacterium]